MTGKAPSPRTVVTADIGGTFVKIGSAVGRKLGEAIARHDTAGLLVADPAERLAHWISAYLEATGTEPDAVVVTIPGSIGPDFDTVRRTANVPSLEGQRIRTGVGRLLGVPTFMERDVHVLLRGEVVDQEITAPHVLGVFVGTGIGSAFLSEGRIFRGAGHAMQLGLCPIRGEGKERPWARPDAFEVYASGRALAEFAAENDIALPDLFIRARTDPLAMRFADALVRDLGLHISTTAILLHPNVLVLGGGVLEMPGFPIDGLVEDIIQRIPVHDEGTKVAVQLSRLGWRAGLLGGESLLSCLDDPAVMAVLQPVPA